MPDSYLEALTTELKTHGVEDWFLDDKGKHYKLRFEYNGQNLMHVFPRTPSDQRGVHNCLSDLRRQMNVKKVIRKSGSRPKTRCKPVAPPPPKAITVKDNPFAVLSEFNKQEPVRCPRMTLSQIAAMLSSSTP